MSRGWDGQAAQRVIEILLHDFAPRELTATSEIMPGSPL
jgi:hypothetical protein